MTFQRYVEALTLSATLSVVLDSFIDRDRVPEKKFYRGDAEVRQLPFETNESSCFFVPFVDPSHVDATLFLQRLSHRLKPLWITQDVPYFPADQARKFLILRPKSFKLPVQTLFNSKLKHYFNPYRLAKSSTAGSFDIE
jgi:hypothetical protein